MRDVANRTITIGTYRLSAALCEDCPGGMLIYPPDKLTSHQDRQHGDERIERVCRRCFEIFSVARHRGPGPLASTCPKCIAARAAKRPKRKQMSGTGIEKKEAIRCVSPRGSVR
jgi:hypothetical protein